MAKRKFLSKIALPAAIAAFTLGAGTAYAADVTPALQQKMLHRNAAIERRASMLGMTAEEYRAARADGKTLPQMAAERGVNLAAIRKSEAEPRPADPAPQGAKFRAHVADARKEKHARTDGGTVRRPMHRSPGFMHSRR